MICGALEKYLLTYSLLRTFVSWFPPTGLTDGIFIFVLVQRPSSTQFMKDGYSLFRSLLSPSIFHFRLKLTCFTNHLTAACTAATLQTFDLFRTLHVTGLFFFTKNNSVLLFQFKSRQQIADTFLSHLFNPLFYVSYRMIRNSRKWCIVLVEFNFRRAPAILAKLSQYTRASRRLAQTVKSDVANHARTSKVTSVWKLTSKLEHWSQTLLP